MKKICSCVFLGAICAAILLSVPGHARAQDGGHGFYGNAGLHAGMGYGQGAAIAHRVHRLIALEHIVNLGLTAPEIDKSLPVLQDIADGQAALQDKVNLALDAAEAELLAAPPGQAPTLTILDKMRDEATDLRTRQANDQGRLDTILGADRSEQLLSIVGLNKPQDMPPPPDGPGPPHGHRNDGAFTGDDFQGAFGQRLTVQDLIDLLKQREDALKKTAAVSAP